MSAVAPVSLLAIVSLLPLTCTREAGAPNQTEPAPQATAPAAAATTPAPAATTATATPSAAAARPGASTATATPPPVGSCGGPLFVERIAADAWTEVRVPAGTMDGIRDAIASSDRRKPTRVTLAPGTYRGQCLYVEDHMRTADAPLWIRGEGEVQIDCTDGNGQAIAFDHVAYVALEHVTVGPASGYYGDSAVHIAGKPIDPTNRASHGRWDVSHHVLVRDVTARNLNRGPDGDGDPNGYESGCCDGIKVNQAQHIWLIGNHISRTARHGIDNVGVHDLFVCNNLLEDLMGTGVGIEAKGGSENVLFEGNVVVRARHRGFMLGGEGSGNVYMWPVDADYEGKHQVARNNIVINAAEAGFGFFGCHDCVASHNTVWVTSDYEVGDRDMLRAYNSVIEGGDDYWGPARRVGEVLRNRDNLAVGNLFGTAAGGMTCPLNANADSVAGLRLVANLWWNGGKPLAECGEGPTSIVSRRDAASFYGDRDPKIVAAGSTRTRPDLRPQAGSPLVGAGARDDAPRTDQRGRTRPARPAIGALEP
ncbi:MAG: right-handed parallel beta-helix repeat-containing protein [Nannocystaceae bacterium]|nr:right-handed parallel beta-helix repeat-containing protein [Nannocystaceae bacterium]